VQLKYKENMCMHSVVGSKGHQLLAMEVLQVESQTPATIASLYETRMDMVG
jgi:hypothetical protein